MTASIKILTIGNRRFVSKRIRTKSWRRRKAGWQDNMKMLLAMSLNFTTKLNDEASVLGFLCNIIKLQPLLPEPENLEMLDASTFVSIIKSNVLRYQDVSAISKYEKLSEVRGYFARNYLNNPNILRLVFKPIYELSVPTNTNEAVKNINTLVNILSSVKSAQLLDQINQQDYKEAKTGLTVSVHALKMASRTTS